MAYPKGEWKESIHKDYEKNEKSDIVTDFIYLAERFFDAKDRTRFVMLCGKAFSPNISEIFQHLERRELIDFFARRQDVLREVISVLENMLRDIERDIENTVYTKALEQAWYSQENIQSLIISQKQLNIITSQVIWNLKKLLSPGTF